MSSGGGGPDENHQAVGVGGAKDGFNQLQVSLCSGDLANSPCGGGAGDFPPIR